MGGGVIQRTGMSACVGAGERPNGVVEVDAASSLGFSLREYATSETKTGKKSRIGR